MPFFFVSSVSLVYFAVPFFFVSSVSLVYFAVPFFFAAVGSLGMWVLCKLIGCFANYKFISLSNNIHVVFYAHLIIYVDG